MYELKFVWRHATPIIPSLIARIQSIAASVQKLPDSVVKSVGRARHRQSMYQANDEVTDQFEAGHLLFTCNILKRQTNIGIQFHI